MDWSTLSPPGERSGHRRTRVARRERCGASRGGRDIVQCLADLAATTIEHSRTVDQTVRLVSQLQTALEHRITLEQAKGILAERLGIDCATAFREIRATACREQRPIGDFAATILAGRTTPAR